MLDSVARIRCVDGPERVSHAVDLIGSVAVTIYLASEPCYRQSYIVSNELQHGDAYAARAESRGAIKRRSAPVVDANAALREYAAAYRRAADDPELPKKTAPICAEAGYRLDAIIEDGLLKSPRFGELVMSLRAARVLRGAPQEDARRHFERFISLMSQRRELIDGTEFPKDPSRPDTFGISPDWLRRAFLATAEWLEPAKRQRSAML